MRETLLAITLIASGLLVFLRLHKSLRAPFPPGPKPQLLVGNMLDIMASEPWLLYMRWEKVYQSKILGLTLPGKRMVILNSAEDAIELLEKRAGIYSDRTRIPLIELVGWTFDTGLMRNNERWRSERKIFHQTFKRESVELFLPIQTAKVHAMLRQLLSNPECFADHYKMLSAAVILEIVFGYEVRSKNDRIIQVLERAISELIENGNNSSVAALNVFPTLRYLPRWMPGTGFHRVVDDCRQYTKDMLDIPFEYVKDSMSKGQSKPSLVSSLLEKNQIAEESIKGIGGTAFSGIQVISVLECFFFAMSLHRDKQREAQGEIDRVVGPDRLPTFEDRDSLPYIDAIIREALRWLPPSPLTVPHVAQEDDIYKGKTDGRFDPRAMSHDKTKYEDPESFIPERFIDENGKLKENMRILAFGFGRRLCPGLHLAINTVWLTVATVLATFNIGPPYDGAGNSIKFQQVYTKADVLHMKPYNCAIEPRSTNARKLVEETEYTTG
ncbi:hypothetical protein NP233_g5569 [Leucocoprinus birnbaumii]|uniref:Cytochrome P450 n=1 Tax=Leucocoprinus birnbaumii TaxID=56174 RepID=A0AAD5VSZ9_9AGAR|nr:hypothetical protein NP233_g5569 [Leucocoprinus birnbaumii]